MPPKRVSERKRKPAKKYNTEKSYLTPLAVTPKTKKCWCGKITLDELTLQPGNYEICTDPLTRDFYQNAHRYTHSETECKKVRTTLWNGKHTWEYEAPEWAIDMHYDIMVKWKKKTKNWKKR